MGNIKGIWRLIFLQDLNLKSANLKKLSLERRTFKEELTLIKMRIFSKFTIKRCLLKVSINDKEFNHLMKKIKTI